MGLLNGLGLGIGIAGGLFSCVAVGLSHYITDVCDKGCDECAQVSECFAKKEISWLHSDYMSEWMLVSYLKVRKGCQYSYSCLPWQRILCFILSFICFFLPFWSEGMGVKGMIFGITAMALFFLSIVDWNTQYIPFEMSLLIFLCGLIHLFADISNWLEYVIGLIAVSGFLLLINGISVPMLRKKYKDDTIDTAIGDGDIKLMAATGLLLGWKLNFLALMIGCIAGSVIHLILMKIKVSGSKFALGPYLSLGVYISMICGEQLLSWYLNLMGVKPL